MTMTTTTRTPTPIGHREAFALAETAYDRFAGVVESVRSDQWDLPTDCEDWTVRDLVGHMVGAMRSAASMRELFRQQKEVSRRHRRDGGNDTDIMTALQIELTAELGTDELVAQCRRLVTPAAVGRRRTPAPARRWVSFPVEFGTTSESWKLGYLVDVVLTRDAWLHRIDLCRALGVPPELTADHDGRLVADVVAEWARRHGQPCLLTLTGPAGGTFVFGSTEEAERLELDAVEFCRTLSGREQGTGLAATDVPF